MSAHIDYVVTEVIAEAESHEESNTQDTRWEEAQRIEYTLARLGRFSSRVSAEGFDD